MSAIVSSAFSIDRNFETFIATGNVPLNTGQGLPQTTGIYNLYHPFKMIF